MKGPERLVIQRKQHPKLCCSGQQEKPLTVEEELKTLYLLLTTWWRTLIWNQFKKSNCNNRQRKGRQPCQLSLGDFPTEVRWWGDLRFWWKFRYQKNLGQFFLSLSVTFTSMISYLRSEIIILSKFVLREKCTWMYVDRCLVPVRRFPSPSRSIHFAWTNTAAKRTA